MKLIHIYRNKYILIHNTPAFYRKNSTSKTSSTKHDIIFKENISHPHFNPDMHQQELDCEVQILMDGTIRLHG